MDFDYPPIALGGGEDPGQNHPLPGLQTEKGDFQSL
jgi:hypothetical protein